VTGSALVLSPGFQLFGECETHLDRRLDVAGLAAAGNPVAHAAWKSAVVQGEHVEAGLVVGNDCAQQSLAARQRHVRNEARTNDAHAGKPKRRRARFSHLPRDLIPQVAFPEAGWIKTVVGALRRASLSDPLQPQAASASATTAR
jgi:hypothetical protein